MGVLDEIFYTAPRPTPMTDAVMAKPSGVLDLSAFGAPMQDATALTTYANSLPPQPTPGVRFASDPHEGMTHTTSYSAGEMPPNIVDHGGLLPVAIDDRGRSFFDPIGSGLLSSGIARSVIPGVGLLHGLSGLPGVVRDTAESMKSAATLPGDVATGKVDPMSEEGQGRALEMAGAFGAGASVMPKPAGSLGIFGGRMAKTADLDMHDIAAANYTLKGMPGYENVTPESILKDTGWFKGIDGEMRHEIPDHLAALKTTSPSGTARLGDVFDHSLLYDAYPHFADAKVHFEPMEGRGAYDVGTGSIAINNTLSPADMRSTLLHELQHGVQEKEGFVSGSNPTHLDEGFDAYHRTAGEVEARNVQAREPLDGADRLETPPWQTQDVGEHGQLLAPREWNEPQHVYDARQLKPFYIKPVPTDAEFLGILGKMMEEAAKAPSP